VSKPIVVRAPATSANLGPGFDCLGLALDLWNEIEAVPGPSESPDNLILRAARAVFDQVDAPFPDFQLRSSNHVPLGRGLGSSATAIACGVLLANHCLGRPLPESALLDLAARLEGHPDNVVPCLLGGIQVATADAQGHIVHARIPLGTPLRAVVFVPEQHMLTVNARALLPRSVPMGDAAFNVARAALLVAALTSGQADLLAEATRDRLHQPYRQPGFPPSATLFDAAMHAGALAVFTSGAGPSVLALGSDDAQATAVADAFAALGLDGSTLRLALSERGAHVVDD
jgi:homoserine kinase